MKDSVVIVYVKNGYKLDNGYGKFINKDQSWAKLADAVSFCEAAQLDYTIA